jgi:hypothetical protein
VPPKLAARVRLNVPVAGSLVLHRPAGFS